ncbi:MAG TPA: hypothetical protein VK423_00365 [Thermoplasmata archaeon]|nr:hypothetical protein [Thermoplasmata archaeon]
MSERTVSLLSLPVFAALLAALTLGLILLGRYYNLGTTTFALFAVPVLLAVVYLAWYRTLPYESPRARRVPAPAEDEEEPFEDPVEEADRMTEPTGEDDLDGGAATPDAPAEPETDL